VIKRIHNHLNAQEDFVARFEDEARLAAMLRHPNIVRVEDFGDEDGTLFMALEYIEGWEFADLLRRGSKSGNRIPDALAIEVIMQIAEALDYAHSLRDQSGQPLRIVHRDVSPQNILIERGTGTAKLLDFGIASAESNLHETQAGLIKGKIAYFSPEQARGEALDGRTDLYALGLVLHEALIGKRVFRGDSMVQLLREVTEAKVPPLIASRPDLPREALVAVDRATTLDRDDRFATGAAMAAALRHALNAMGGSLGRSAMDAWVGSLPARSELPKTGNTSAVSVVASGSEPTHIPKTTDATLAVVPTQPETLLADPETVLRSPVAASSPPAQHEEADEATVIAGTDHLTQPQARVMSQGPAALKTQPVVQTKDKSFSVVLVVSVILGLGFAISQFDRAEPAAQSETHKSSLAEPLAEPQAPAPVQAAEVKPEPAAAADTGRPKVEPEPVDSTEPVVEAAPAKAAPKRRRASARKRRKAAAVEEVVVTPQKAPAVAQPARASKLAQRDLDAVTMRHFQALTNCRGEAKGIVISLQIHKTGMPFSVRVSGAPLEVTTCLRKLVRKWRYPAHDGSAVRHKIKL
jgi:serine/threonine protein kinase